MNPHADVRNHCALVGFYDAHKECMFLALGTNSVDSEEKSEAKSNDDDDDDECM
jgi:hypothetical protein